jgi:DNA-binding GntR family transcriptional regulator
VGLAAPNLADLEVAKRNQVSREGAAMTDRYQTIALHYRGEEPALQHQALLDCALKRDAAQARAVLTMHVNNCVEHALAKAVLR